MMLNQKKIQALQLLVRSYFKNAKGEPFEMTPKQCELFESVINPAYHWVWDSAPTRYGKSDIISMACLYLAVFHRLKIPIVAGSEDKAKKIMEYVVQHIGDHPDIYNGLINVNISEIDKLKVTVSKDALRWSDGGWIYIVSIDSRSLIKKGEGVVGDGGDVVVLEEAGLIRDKEQFSKVVRMPERNNGWGKLVQSGNCVENSVFEDAFNSPLYHKVRITLEDAVREGRYSEDELDEKKSQTTSKDWKRYYLVEFPEANEFTYFKPKTYDTLPPAGKLKFFGATDPALGKTKKGSLVGLIVLGVDDDGQAYEIESIGEHMTPDEIMKRVFNLQYIFQRFGVEAIAFQAFFLKVMEDKSKKEGRYIPFEAIQQKRSKEERIESLEPFINTGQILFKGNGILWDHMQDYPEGEFMDVLDTLEMCWRLIHGDGFEFSFI